MRKWILLAAVLLLVGAGAVWVIRLQADFTEGAAQARLYTDCLLATDANTAFCQTSKVFETYRADILACYAADSSTAAFRLCLERHGIQNPPR